jgi:hypothetical protein
MLSVQSAAGQFTGFIVLDCAPVQGEPPRCAPLRRGQSVDAQTPNGDRHATDPFEVGDDHVTRHHGADPFGRPSE